MGEAPAGGVCFITAMSSTFAVRLRGKNVVYIASGYLLRAFPHFPSPR
jgi:hypothetical protein